MNTQPKILSQGTQEFLCLRIRFVDAERVGHLGASYGGFMTMLGLATIQISTQRRCRHAGIFQLSPRIWGHGWWGLLYSERRQ